MDVINLSTFFNALNRKLEPPIKQHLKNVYGCMAMTLLMTSVGFYVHLINLINVGFLSSLALVGLSIALATTPDNGKNHNKRLGYLLGFAFCSGLNLGPLLDLALFINPSIIITAFLSTCLLFTCFSLSVIFSDQRRWLYLSGTLSSALSCLLFLSLINLFFGSKLLFNAYIYLGLFVMCGFVVYDTAVIIEKCRMGDTDYIWHTVLLFVDFITIFKNIVVILMNKEENKSRKKK